jgi:N-dimethylarginine dimethylaminohydrolase
MVIAAVKERTVLIYPAFTPWETYQWLRDHAFTIIEVPRDEHYRFTPENLLNVEPGKVIVNAGARETIKRLEAQKVEVIPFDCHGIMQGGVNGMRCITLEMRREEGPSLDG